MEFHKWLSENPPDEDEVVVAHPFHVPCVCIQIPKFVGCVCNCHNDLQGNRDRIFWAKYKEGHVGCL